MHDQLCTLAGQIGPFGDPPRPEREFYILRRVASPRADLNVMFWLKLCIDFDIDGDDGNRGGAGES